MGKGPLSTDELASRPPRRGRGLILTEFPVHFHRRERVCWSAADWNQANHVRDSRSYFNKRTGEVIAHGARPSRFRRRGRLGSGAQGERGPISRPAGRKGERSRLLKVRANTFQVHL